LSRKQEVHYRQSESNLGKDLGTINYGSERLTGQRHTFSDIQTGRGLNILTGASEWQVHDGMRYSTYEAY
jgi:hypothetical protein